MFFYADEISTEFSDAKTGKSDSYSDSFESSHSTDESEDSSRTSISSVKKKTVNTASVQTEPVHVVQPAALDPGNGPASDVKMQDILFFLSELVCNVFKFSFALPPLVSIVLVMSANCSVLCVWFEVVL